MNISTAIIAVLFLICGAAAVAREPITPNRIRVIDGDTIRDLKE